MDVGMMWLDDNKKRSLAQKVERASEYYRDKYGRHPTFCHVHRQSVEEEAQIGDIQLIPDPQILPNHFWLGVKPN